jgi:predicted DNA-binding transcriptional regulator YafY
MSTASTKIQRWVDLMAALLSHHGTQTFEDLAKEVPAYAKGKPDSTKRTFERDKLELRELGIPIETIGETGEEDTAYRLRAKDFYMPYLALVSERGRTKPSRVDKYGYRALSELAFDADELLAVADAARRVAQLGNPDVAADAQGAMRKLAFDLPLDAALGEDDGTTVRQPRAIADPETLRALAKALHARKTVSFAYRSMQSDREDGRTVEPYGLFFLNAHWYLVARDLGDNTVKNFRASRVSKARVNSAKAGTPDYTIPAGFRLREHARSRQPWELGESEVTEAVIEIRGDSGATLAAAELGQRVPGHASRRAFSVRRPDVFARWCLSFAGEVVPVAPSSMVEEFDRQRKATVALYAS